MFSRKIAVSPLFLIPFFFPHLSFASVLINEIAWMGTLESGTNEWIELVNTTATPIDLSGWRIEAADGSPSLALSGVIAENGFFLIERTDDTTIPNISADLVAPFGSGLGNTGETLRLKDASGVIVDVVVGGEGWGNIGGDNTTKETPQRTAPSSSASWTTAPATPRATNSIGGEVLGASTGVNTTTASDASLDQTATTASDTKSAKSAYAASLYPREHMTLTLSAPSSAMVGLPATFKGNALGLYDEPLPYASYRWNFGDGVTGEGVTVPHAYAFPGEYIVTLHVRNASLDATRAVTVVVNEATLEFARIEDGIEGFVTITNKSKEAVDISGWRLHADLDGTLFFFPEHSLIPANRSIAYPNKVTGMKPSGGLSLQFPDGTRVLSHEVKKAAQGAVLSTSGHVAAVVASPRSAAVTEVRSKEVSVAPVAVQTTPDTLTKETPLSATDTIDEVVLFSSDVPVSPLIAAFGSAPVARWFFVFSGFLLLVLAAVILARSHVDRPTPADEYAIIEDIIEGEDEENTPRR